MDDRQRCILMLMFADAELSTARCVDGESKTLLEPTT